MHVLIYVSMYVCMYVCMLSQVLGGADDEDADDEKQFMQESLELHYNLSEMIGGIMRTHGDSFLPVYSTQWHESIMEMANPHCLKEDRQFAFYVISDVIEFSLSEESAASFFGSVMPVLSEACANMVASSPRQACAYSMGMAAELYPGAFYDCALPCLQALGACIAMGEVVAYSTIIFTYIELEINLEVDVERDPELGFVVVFLVVCTQG